MLKNGLSACYKLEFDIAALEAMKVDDEIIFADIDPFTIKVRLELQYDKKAAKFLSEHVFCNCLLMYECSQSEE